MRAAGTGYVQYVNFSALSLPATREGTGGALLSPFGDLSRNPGRTPAYYTTDLALNKDFATHVEGLRVQFRSELYNIFNHTNLYLPSGSLGGTLQTVSAGGTPTSAGTPSSGGCGNQHI